MGPLVWRAVIFGYFFGWFGDVFTKSGVAAFYPATSARLVIPRNPRLRLATGTRGEYVLFVAFIALLIVSIHINSAGGLMRSFSSLLAQPESAAALYQKEGAHHRILANIVGRHTATGERVVMEDAEILDVEVQRLLVRDQSGSLFEVGSRQFCVDCQIQVEKVRARVGPAIEVQTQDLRFEDREIAEAFSAIRAPENARVSLCGELTIKDAPLLSWPRSLRSFNSITVSGAEGSSERKVKLREATLDEARGLAEYIAAGSLIIKVVRDVK
jgi:inner membrane protein